MINDVLKKQFYGQVQEILTLLCSKHVSYNRAVYILETALQRLRETQQQELFNLRIAAHIDAENNHLDECAELTTKFLSLGINEDVDGTTQSCIDIIKGVGIG